MACIHHIQQHHKYNNNLEAVDIELNPVQSVAAVIWEKSCLHMKRWHILTESPLSKLASAPKGSNSVANAHTIWSECVFAHAALWEEEKREKGDGMQWKDAFWEDEKERKVMMMMMWCDDGRQYPTYQKRLSSLVSDSDSVGGTIVMCRTEVRWGKEGWRGGKEKRSANSYSAGKSHVLSSDLGQTENVWWKSSLFFSEGFFFWGSIWFWGCICQRKPCSAALASPTVKESSCHG